MAKRPEERFANGTEVANAIGAMLKRASIAMAPHVVPTARAAFATIPPVVVRSETTLSASASSMELDVERLLAAGARRRRFVSAAALVGIIGFGGGAAYLGLRSTSDSAAPAAVAAVTPVTPPVAPTPDARPEQARRQLVYALEGFLRWSTVHTGEPCPDRTDLAAFLDDGSIDPWANPLVITCTAQPADQIVGVISRGPDGMLGTADDITSWSLGPDDTRLIHGPRWQAAPIAPPVAVTPHEPRPTKQPTPPRRHTTAAVAPPPVETTPPVVPPEVAKPPPAGDPTGPTFKGTTLGDDGIPTSR